MKPHMKVAAFEILRCVCANHAPPSQCDYFDPADQSDEYRALLTIEATLKAMSFFSTVGDKYQLSDAGYLLLDTLLKDVDILAAVAEVQAED